MKLVPKPTANAAVILNACLSGLSPASARPFLDAYAEIISKFDEYNNQAGLFKLHTLLSCARAKGDQIVAGNVTKKEFVDLYKYQMLDVKNPARKHYNELMMQEPLRKCPYCGFSQTTTLDHYLSKARYPAFSVLSFNLIPSCSDCNKGKGASVLLEAEQTFHPYYEHDVIQTQLWLRAQVVQTSPPTIRFYVDPPAQWPEDLKERANNHFKQFDLEKRFGIEASSELITISNIVSNFTSLDEKVNFINIIVNSERKVSLNSWKAALYGAVSTSIWYLNSGFTMLI